MGTLETPKIPPRTQTGTRSPVPRRDEPVEIAKAVVERKPYLKMAFANPYNLSLLLGGIAASVLTANPLPALVALGLGLAAETLAALNHNLNISGALGILGMTLLWDALEFRRQQKRVQRGHAPANPCNPRHWRLMSQGQATTVDWLAREPAGRPLSRDEILALTSKRQTQ